MNRYAISFYWELTQVDEDGEVVESHRDASLLGLCKLAETFCLLDEDNKIALVRCINGDTTDRFELKDGALQPNSAGRLAPTIHRNEFGRVARALGFAQ
jgi:hypothetical protein